jgi:hypothetical protein
MVIDMLYIKNIENHVHGESLDGSKKTGKIEKE